MEISTIIPCYNSQETILESVDSVVRECVNTSYSWELIIVDDGSVDNSMKIVEQYINESSYKSNIILIKQENGGAAVARNEGILVSRGKFIAFNDSDDRWLPGRLKIQIEYLRNNPNVMLVGGIYGTDNMSKIKRLKQVTEITINDQILKNYFAPPTVLLRKSILDKAGLFNSQMRYAEEGFFFNNIVYYGKSVLINNCFSEPITSKKRWGDNGLSGNIIKMEQGELFNIKSAYNLGYISWKMYVFSLCFSILKFFRRWCLSKIYKMCK